MASGFIGNWAGQESAGQQACVHGHVSTGAPVGGCKIRTQRHLLRQEITSTYCEGSSFISLRNALLNFRFKSSALSYFFINMSELKRGQVLEREEEQR